MGYGYNDKSLILKHFKKNIMKNFAWFLIINLLIFGCSNPRDEFQNYVIDFASDDIISDEEFNELFGLASESPSYFMHLCSDNDKVNEDKTYAYLCRFCTSKFQNREIKIFNPTSIIDKNEIRKFNFHIYLENSASMDGYVKGVTEFETAIYNLLGDIKISGICDSLNLHYINNTIPFSKFNALPADIQDFIERLEPTTFRQKGGNRGTSDIERIFETVLTIVDDKNAVVLISDFVFSPGSGEDAEEYLTNQSVGIKLDFAQKINELDLASVLIHLESNFKGAYYNKFNNATSIDCKRPYYIWIIGNYDQIVNIQKLKILESIKGGYEHKLVFASVQKPQEPNYKILYRPRIGDFKLASGSKGNISDAQRSKDNRTKGLFGFNAVVDNSNSFQDLEYFEDITNYKINTKYEIIVNGIVTNNDVALKGFTHNLFFQTKELKDETIEVKVIGKVPDWIREYSSINDLNIENDTLEQRKTFGLKYLVEGVNDAFYPNSKNNVISQFSITIKK